MTVRLSMEAEKTELIVPKNPFSFVSTEISFEFGPLQSGKTNGGRMRQILKVLTLVLLYFGEHAFGYGRPKKGEALSVSQKNLMVHSRPLLSLVSSFQNRLSIT